MNRLSQLFEPQLAEEIKELNAEMAYKEGDLIIDYGKYIRIMPLIMEGNVKVLKRDEEGRELLLYYLTPFETCSMAYTCCLEAKQSEIRAIAEDDVRLIAIPHAKLDEWLCKYLSWKTFIMQGFNMRFLELMKSMESIAFKKLDERLVDYLREKQTLGHSSVIKASHSQIAEDLATSRVVISRLLKQLENDKKLILYRNEIKLLHHFNHTA